MEFERLVYALTNLQKQGKLVEINAPPFPNYEPLGALGNPFEGWATFTFRGMPDVTHWVQIDKIVGFRVRDDNDD